MVMMLLHTIDGRSVVLLLELRRTCGRIAGEIVTGSSVVNWMVIGNARGHKWVLFVQGICLGGYLTGSPVTVTADLVSPFGVGSRPRPLGSSRRGGTAV